MSLRFILWLVADSGRGPVFSWHIGSTKCDNKMRVGTVLNYFRFFDDETF
jgi:hypothetical protein